MKGISMQLLTLSITLTAILTMNTALLHNAAMPLPAPSSNNIPLFVEEPDAQEQRSKAAAAALQGKPAPASLPSLADNRKEVKEKEEKQREYDKATLHLPEQAGQTTTIDLKTTIDTFSQETLATLIQKQHALLADYILVRVTTENIDAAPGAKTAFYTDYFDAHEFNKYYFSDNKQYPLFQPQDNARPTNVESLCYLDKSKKNRFVDINNNMPLSSNGIQYFICKPGSTDFYHLCSHANLFLGSHRKAWHALFETNNTPSPLPKFKALYQNKEFKTLYDCLKNLDLSRIKDENEKSHIYYLLAKIYGEGLGGTQQNFQKAFLYASQIDQNKLEKKSTR